VPDWSYNRVAPEWDAARASFVDREQEYLELAFGHLVADDIDDIARPTTSTPDDPRSDRYLKVPGLTE
jgi:hypothetical protein